MDTISVIIPLFNRAGLIAETLASIEKQSIQPYQVVIVDDHSSDASVDVVNEFKKTSGLNIVILHNGYKRGQSGALNWGIEKAAGDFIAMQDSDDLWMPTHLQKLHEALGKHPESSIAFSAIEVFGPANDTLQKNNDFSVSVKRSLDNAFEKNDNGLWVSNGDLLFNLLMFGVPFRCPASLIRKDFLIKHGLFFDTDITYTLDSQFMTIASYFTPFLYVDAIGLRIRRHTGNDGDVGYGDKIRKSFKLRADRLKNFFLNHKISSKEKKALYHRLWCLQAFAAGQEASGQGLMARGKQAFELLRNVPTWSSAKSAVKILANRHSCESRNL